MFDTPTGLCLLASLVGFSWWWYFRLFSPKEYEIVVVGDYEEYETFAAVAAIWFDSNAIGMCEDCGCNDAPVYGSITQLRQLCKWCCELRALTYHLNNYGTRQYRKAA